MKGLKAGREGARCERNSKSHSGTKVDGHTVAMKVATQLSEQCSVMLDLSSAKVTAHDAFENWTDRLCSHSHTDHAAASE